MGSMDTQQWTLQAVRVPLFPDSDNESRTEDDNFTQALFTVDPFDGNATISADSKDHIGSFTLWQTVLLAILASIFSVVTIGGNLTVLLSFVIERSIRQPTNYFIASLAVSDLIIGVVSMPFYALYLLADKHWLLGEVVCDIWLSIDYTVCLCSIYTVFCITIDRFCSVRIPAKYRNWRSERKVLVIVAITWTVPIAVFFTTIIGWQYFVGVRTVPADKCTVQYMENPIFNCLLQVGYFWITLIVMCVLYSGIYRVALNLQRKSDAKQKKMTTLVSVAGQEISKIGIGMSKRSAATAKTFASNLQAEHAESDVPPGRNQQPANKHPVSLLSPDSLPQNSFRRGHHSGSNRDVSPYSMPCTSSTSFSSNKTPGVDEERSSSPAMASDSSQSPSSRRAVPKAHSARKRRPGVAASSGQPVIRTKSGRNGKTVVVKPPRPLSDGGRQHLAAALGSRTLLDGVGHLSAESVDNIDGLDETRFAYPFVQSESKRPINKNHVDSESQNPPTFSCVNFKQSNHLHVDFDHPKYGSKTKCHKSAEILYSNDEDDPLPIHNSHDDHHWYNKTTPTNRHPSNDGSLNEEVFLQEDGSGQKQNVFVIPGVDCSFRKVVSPRFRILDGSEFLLRAHVDSGMKARRSMGNLHTGGYSAVTSDTCPDSPTSPVWKVRRECSDSSLDFLETAKRCSSWQQNDDAYRHARPTGKIFETSSFEKLDRTASQFNNNTFQYPTDSHFDEKHYQLQLTNSRSCASQDASSWAALKDRCYSRGTSTLGRSCSEYEGYPPDTAMTDVEEDWQKSGPIFNLSVPPVPSMPKRGFLTRDSTTTSESGEFRSSRHSRGGSGRATGKPQSRREASKRRERASQKSPSTNGKQKTKSPPVVATKKKSLDDDLDDSSRRRSHQQAIKASKSENRARKALRTISIILGAFVLCWTPWHVLSLIISVYPNVHVLEILYDISYWLCYLNSPINPFCYAFVNQQFKKTFVRILKCDWHRT